MTPLEVMQAIENASERSYYVFCDQEDYIVGKWVGQHKFHSAWNSKASALIVASKQVNGVVYNRQGKQILGY